MLSAIIKAAEEKFGEVREARRMSQKGSYKLSILRSAPPLIAHPFMKITAYQQEDGTIEFLYGSYDLDGYQADLNYTNR